MIDDKLDTGMGDQTTFQSETLASEGDTGAETTRRIPVLTIMTHPDASRIGDRLALPVLAAGRHVRLSRLEPVFIPPRGGESRALADRHLSRQPISLEGSVGEDKILGEVTIDRRSSPTSLRVDGAKVEGRLTLDADSLERGVVLELGNRVVLLLHTLDPARQDILPSLGLVGESSGLTRLRREVLRVADREVPVLLRGETGTGKELVARALHDAGSRRQKPFVAVNIASLTSSLAAADLFGSTKGAFTGAVRSKPGYFQTANGGTLFLDEVGEASVDLQVLLLRTLETKTVIPVGGVDPVAVDVRIIAATDLDLEQAMNDGRFRMPLYHRLAGFSIRIPPLRDRRDDIGRLLFCFLRRELETLGGWPDAGEAPWPSTRVVSRLVRYDWPGNVRQLLNVARWLAICDHDSPRDQLRELENLLNEGSARRHVRGEANPSSMASRATAGPSNPSPPPAAAAKVRKLRRAPTSVGDEELLAALRDNGWRLKPTAEQLGVSRTSLYALIDRCPKVRRASDLGAEELVKSLERSGGDLMVMARELEISPQGLRHRIQELGLEPSIDSTTDT